MKENGIHLTWTSLSLAQSHWWAVNCHAGLSLSAASEIAGSLLIPARGVVFIGTFSLNSLTRLERGRCSVASSVQNIKKLTVALGDVKWTTSVARNRLWPIFIERPRVGQKVN